MPFTVLQCVNKDIIYIKKISTINGKNAKLIY